MGTYSYECPEHGEIELEHGMKDDRNKKKCPKCKKKLEPLITGGSGVIFKGNDWGSKKAIAPDTNLSDIAGHNRFKG